jgi:hypothetical protein
MRRSRKPLCVLLAYREFESPPLRFGRIPLVCRGSGHYEPRIGRACETAGSCQKPPGQHLDWRAIGAQTTKLVEGLSRPGVRAGARPCCTVRPSSAHLPQVGDELVVAGATGVGPGLCPPKIATSRSGAIRRLIEADAGRHLSKVFALVRMAAFTDCVAGSRALRLGSARAAACRRYGCRWNSARRTPTCRCRLGHEVVASPIPPNSFLSSGSRHPVYFCRSSCRPRGSGLSSSSTTKPPAMFRR